MLKSRLSHTLTISVGSYSLTSLSSRFWHRKQLTNLVYKHSFSSFQGPSTLHENEVEDFCDQLLVRVSCIAEHGKDLFFLYRLVTMLQLSTFVAFKTLYKGQSRRKLLHMPMYCVWSATHRILVLHVSACIPGRVSIYTRVSEP